MNYIELINRFWIENAEYSFTGNEAKLYFYLLNISNSLGWKNPFRQSDRQIQLGTGISVNSIKSARNRLSQSGLISFKSGKRGNKFDISNKTVYELLSVSIFDPDTHPDTDTDTHPHTDPDTHPDTGGINKQKKTKQNIKKDTKEKFDLSFVDTAYLRLVRNFIDYRSKDLKKPFKTERGVKMFYNELLKLSGENIQKAKGLVAYAKDKEWQTVYPITKDSKTNEDNGKGKNNQSNSESIEGKTKPLDYSERF